MENGAGVKGVDVPIGDLVPLHQRNIKQKKSYRKILASIRAIGLIEPLCVYEEQGKYLILDGYLRYRACLELKLVTVPCLILPTKEAYTPNRMVNYLRPDHELRMLKESLQELDEATVAKTLGLDSIKHPAHERILSRLHPQLVEAMYKHHGQLWRCTAKTHTGPEMSMK